MRMQVEKKSGLLWKGRRVPCGGEIFVGTAREARTLEAVGLARRLSDQDAPRKIEAILEAPSVQRGPLVERITPATVILTADVVTALHNAPELVASAIETVDPESNTRDGGSPLEVLKAEPETADATAGDPANESPGGGPMGAGQASAEAPATEPEKPRRGRKAKSSPAAEPAAGAGEGVE